MKATTLISLAASFLLIACGGGGDHESTAPVATQAVPASASSSVSGLLDYLTELVKAAADTLEPVSLAGVQPVTTETEEPRAID